MDAILISSNTPKSELHRLHCSSLNKKILIRSEKCFNNAVNVQVLNINGENIHQENGNYFKLNKEYTLNTELCTRGIYIVKTVVDNQSFVETLYFI